MNRCLSLLLAFGLCCGLASAQQPLTDGACEALRKPGLTQAEMTKRYGAASFTSAEVTKDLCAKYRIGGLPSGPEKGQNFYYVTEKRIYQF